jgi:hypothetical protein
VTAKALRVLRDRKAHLPEAAIGRVKALRRLFLWVLVNDFIQQDPSRDARRLAHTSQGYHTWTLEEVEQSANAATKPTCRLLSARPSQKMEK